MKMQETRNIFNYLRENVVEQEENDIDYIIDFKNGECFCIDQLGELLDKYYKIIEEIEEYTDDNNLDNVVDCEKIKSNFKEYSKFMRYDQATLVDFKDYALKVVNQISISDGE